MKRRIQKNLNCSGCFPNRERLGAKFYAAGERGFGMIKKVQNIDQMRERHKREIEALQKNCRHKRLSKWMEEWWAVAHSTGNMVKLCIICGKVIKRKGMEFKPCRIAAERLEK